MRQFPLTVGGGTFQFDTDGRVLDSSANVVGRWSTTPKNKIEFHKSAGGSEEVAVDWTFNALNQLAIGQAGQNLFTVTNTVEGLPRYYVSKNVLYVDPDGDGDFEFPLQCQWGMDAAGNLVVSINGTQSVLDGFLEDRKSRFRFQFYDKQLPNFPNSLVLSGRWVRKNVNTEIRLGFELDDAQLAISGKPLDLPAALRVDPSRNHLALVYQSKSNGERRLELLGSFQIKPNWVLVFTIDQVKDSGLQKSSIEVQTTFDWDGKPGSLSVYVGKTKQAGAQVIEIGGALKAVYKNGTLDWTFAYRNSTAGGQKDMTLATKLNFSYNQGKNAILITYQQQGTTKTVDVTAKLQATDYAASGGLQITNDPKGRTVKMFLGVSW